MNWRALRRTGFGRTWRASLLELLDEFLVSAGFLIALLAGFYYGSWWVSGCVLLVVFLVSTLVRRVLSDGTGQ